MCGIAGFCSPHCELTKEKSRWISVLEQMNHAQKRRGPDDEGTWLDNHCGLAHVRLAIIDLLTGHQPMTQTTDFGTFSIVFNGEIYNMRELKKELKKEGVTFFTSSDTEVILKGFIAHGEAYIKKLNGIFAIAIYDVQKTKLWLFRDRLGVKPLFYTIQHHTLIFSSEQKGILVYPDMLPAVDKEGLCEILALGPAHTSGTGVFKGILEVLPGEALCFGLHGCSRHFYWKLTSHPHEDSFSHTIEKTGWLLEDAIKLQMLSDIPVCTFLSGGVDSSLVTAVCARELKKQGRQLPTFSFDFKDNEKYFQSSTFQPSQDRPWVEKMSAYSNTCHHFLECDNQAQFDCLFKAVQARDLPCMADVESSMLYFCSLVTEHNQVTLTGECADEIFGGYPWFHKKEFLEYPGFPWSPSMEPRQILLADDVIRELPLKEYALSAYEKTIQDTPRLEGETAVEKRRREISYLNLRWFMATLLDRMDRTSMYSGLEARVPFADHRIVEYVFNVPWHMKCPDKIVKGLLRFAGEQYLPSEILWRKKSPYPKTYDPAYEKLLGDQLKEVLSSPNAPIRVLLDSQKVQKFLDTPSDYGKPWYGQLMAGPQMLAYMLQINYWLETYHIRILS
ncbi:MAG: asparagine synthase (glutamine-hydrolyzing) [Blautia sp.]